MSIIPVNTVEEMVARVSIVLVEMERKDLSTPLELQKNGVPMVSDLNQYCH